MIFNLKSSNLIMACLLSAKASLLLVAPSQAALSSSPVDLAGNSSVEVEVVNLTNNSPTNSDSAWLFGDADVDQNQDVDQTQDVDQNRDRNQAGQTSFIRQV
ncbi:hypothetical protein [Oscillatoria sp. HE19RPO]|uniref:hypothetical protein n=1 Tax=Oscillatoria sp. HE19RPO TaxID=2954806 RepID=UPI0020C3C907|nr:hypothetical protein [Oscillatoria sp. HE19RPO]